MLMCISLAEKLGSEQGLLAFSLHPGVIMNTTLSKHLDWNVDLETLRKSSLNSLNTRTHQVCRRG